MAPYLIMLLCVLGATSAFGQTADAPPAPAAAPALTASPTAYLVGPQDVLNITIYGESQLSGRIRVDNDGSFPFQYLDRVKAEGLTTAQIEGALRAGLSDGYLRDPQVSVEVVEYRSQSVFVTGEVRSPNKYSLPGNSTLMDVLTLAGSVTENAGSWVQITHARRGRIETLGPSASAEYDLRIRLREIQTGQAQDIRVQDGDTIFIPKAERVWVVGQVRNAGGIVFEEGMTVFEAVAAAGGITEKGSNRVEIIRIENGRRKSFNAQQTDVLKPGDQVNVKTRRL